MSIGLGTYNRAHLLRRALDSLLRQGFADFELVLSDNASTDDTARLAAAYADRDPRIRLFRQPTNVGALENFAFVLDQAVGEYFMWASDDDEWDPMFLSTLVAYLDAHPSVSLCAAEARHVDQDWQPISAEAEGGSFREGRPTRSAFQRLLHVACADLYGNLFYGLYRRRVLVEPRHVLWTFRRHQVSCEVPVYLRAALAGDIVVLPQALMTKQYITLQARERHATAVSGPMTAARLAIEKVLQTITFAWQYDRSAWRACADELRLILPNLLPRLILTAILWYRIRIVDFASAQLRVWRILGAAAVRWWGRRSLYANAEE